MNDVETQTGLGPGDAARLLREIAEGTAGATGQAFFDSLVQHVAAALGVHTVFVTECLDMLGDNVRELASLEAGILIATTEYAVAGLPCELVMKGRECFIPRALAQIFPLEPDRLSESYIGLPLLNSERQVIGHLVVVDRQPMPEDTPAANILRIFAARAASELERQHSERALRDSQARYHGLFASNPLPVIVCDSTTLQIIEVNDAAVRLYRYSEAAFLALNLADLCETSVNPLGASRHRTQDGRVIEVETSTYSLDLLGHMATIVLVNDVTERRKLEVERSQTMTLLESRVKARTREIERRQQVAETLRDTLSTLNSSRDLEQLLAFIVGQAGRLLGLDAGAVCGLLVTDGAPSIQGVRGLEGHHASVAQSGWFRFVLEEATRSRESVSVSDISGTFGEPSPFRAVLVAPILVMNEVQGCLALFSLESRDFFEEERSLVATFAEHAALALENARLRDQSGRMAMLEERERLSRELHDSVTQSLYSLTLFAETGRRQAEKGNVLAARDHLEMLGQTAQQTLKDMRLMLHGLRPAALEGGGLLAAIRRRLEAVEERSGVRTSLEVSAVFSFNDTTEEQLFMIVQEALNNALRHAQASHVSVRLETGDGPSGRELYLIVQDDGRGFDTTNPSNGIGLISMRGRAQHLNGRLEIESHPGEGSKVRVSIPWPVE
jgi:signal transduction histidine kinase